MAIGNGELGKWGFRTARTKSDKETDEEGKKRGVSIEGSKRRHQNKKKA